MCTVETREMVAMATVFVRSVIIYQVIKNYKLLIAFNLEIIKGIDQATYVSYHFVVTYVHI